MISAATAGGSGAAVIRARRSAAARAMAARSSAGRSPSAPRIAPDGSSAAMTRLNAATVIT